MELSLPKKGLASGDVEQQPLQEWRKSANQTQPDLSLATYKAPRNHGPRSQLPIDPCPRLTPVCTVQAAHLQQGAAAESQQVTRTARGVLTGSFLLLPGCWMASSLLGCLPGGFQKGKAPAAEGF